MDSLTKHITSILVIVTLYVTLLPLSVSAALAVDSETVSGCGTCASVTYALTNTAGTFLIVGGTSRLNITSATYAGVDLTQKAETGSDNGHSEVWTLESPATGANNVFISSGSVSAFMSSYASTVTGQCKYPIGATEARNGAPYTPTSINITTTQAGSIVYDVIGINKELITGTVGASQTELMNRTDDAKLQLGSRESAATISTVTMSWAISDTADQAGHIAVEIKADGLNCSGFSSDSTVFSDF